MYLMEEFIRQNIILFLPFIIPFVLWSLVWKGMALWRAAKLNHRKWFMALLVVNTVGILEILYLFVFSKQGKSNPTDSHHSL